MDKILKVKKTDSGIASWDSECIDRLFSSSAWHRIDHSPWKADYPYEPDVRFQIIHSDDSIYLRYEVEEEYVKAQYIRPNENVWEDSCVEFFISLDNRQTYYNFEFNVLGTGLIGYGPSTKADRRRLDASVVGQVSTFTQVVNVQGKKKWTIVWSIPKSILQKEIKSGTKAYANFYKCGDKLPQAHFLAWNNIDTPTPSFHQPQFFGEIVFE